jgi:hypothetical protein
MQRAIGKLGDRIGGVAEAIGVAIGKATCDLFVDHDTSAFRDHARHSETIELITVCGFGHHAVVQRLPWDAETQEHRHHGLVRGCRGMAATIV